MIYMKGTYSLGITGYELWVDDQDLQEDTMSVLYVGSNREQISKRYKIQHRNKKRVRQFVRPYGRRIYLDECCWN